MSKDNDNVETQTTKVVCNSVPKIMEEERERSLKLELPSLVSNCALWIQDTTRYATFKYSVLFGVQGSRGSFSKHTQKTWRFGAFVWEFQRLCRQGDVD